VVLPSIEVIIVNYRTPDLAEACARSATAGVRAAEQIDVTIVDGGSADGSAERLSAALADAPDPRIRLLPLQVNGGFGFANNRAMMAIAAYGPLPDYILLLNPDARARPGAIEAMVALLEAQPRAAAVGALLEHEDGRPQSSAFTFPSLRGELTRGARTRLLERLLGEPPTAITATSAREVPWVTGAAVMFRTAALEQTGLFDEGFFLYFEETDLRRRLRGKGWTIWHEPAARVVHLGGVATGIRDTETGRLVRRRVPIYWLQSRRRYFALAGGGGHAVASGLAWLAGRAIWLARAALSSAEDDAPPWITRDFLTGGFWPKPADAKPVIPTFAGPATEQPAWMIEKG
jgi:N-acetylglucosaminyl-diphospho-decaprenol L-rhamnosyltransferase